MGKLVYIVHRDFTDGKSSILGVYENESAAKDVFRAVEKYGSSDYTFSLVASEVIETTQHVGDKDD